ncbi:serine/threonine protein phosphatase [Perkinsela sp. CCAP 1560/4]|nr:serine/threonine protein phosphatase [Perkinsela sp. CCAP 1560/4]|eukprot:KNH07526.1 serine/threonine protein phosphatase [Perkinsela sp. CCAP 1560/4]
MSVPDTVIHQKQCAEQKPVRCFLCGDVFELGKLEHHTNKCITYENCHHCGETVIRRLAKYCPQSLHSDLTLANETLKTVEELVLAIARPFENDAFEHAVIVLQTYVRVVEFRRRIHDLLFSSFWKEIRNSRQSHIFLTQSHTGMSITKNLADTHLDDPYYRSADIDPFLNCPSNKKDFFSAKLIKRMISHFQAGQRLPYETAWKIVEEAIHHLRALPNIPLLDTKHGTLGHTKGQSGQWAVGEKVVVVGDVHGQLHDLLHILLEVGLPNKNQGRVFIFNGDFVDRGSNSMEIILLLYAMMLAAPLAVYLNRGNHEVYYMNEDYGFDMEVITKYDKDLYFLLQRSFDALPLGSCIDGKVLVLHGGIPRFTNTSIEFINSIDRFRPMPIPLQQTHGRTSCFENPMETKEDIVFQDILWSDPCEQNGIFRNDRGAGTRFGPDVSRKFMEHNDLALVFRSHEPFLCGYEKHHDERVITIFSASDYDGEGTNLGSYAVLSASDITQPIFHTYRVRSEKEARRHMRHPLHQLAQASGKSFPYNLNNYHRNSGDIELPWSRSSAIDNVLRYIREQIYSKKNVLLKQFNSMDRTNKGTVWKVEWVEAMSNVMELERLPWFFLREYFAEEDEDGRINYTHFLARYQSEIILNMRRELGEIIPLKFSRAIRQNRHTEKLFFELLDGKYQNILRTTRKETSDEAHTTSIISFGEFEMILNILDIGLTNEEIFHLFNFFDANYDGFLSTRRVAGYVRRNQETDAKVEVQHSADEPGEDSSPRQARLKSATKHLQTSLLELQIMRELQHLFISGKVGVEKAFHFMAPCETENAVISQEDFTKGMKALTGSLKTPMNEEQIENIFHLIDIDKDGQISFDDFNVSFAVRDVLLELRVLRNPGN